jgi:hypothetical protein
MNIMLRNILATIVSIVSITFSAGVLAETTTQHYHPKDKMPSKYTVHWRIFIFSAILALTGLFFTPQLDAEIYKWVDEKGVIHYGNIPPANTGNVKIVSREYQHDEAADQKRVKADQKTIDALTEKTKKGEQQASVGEQKKSEKAKQNQTPSQEERIESEKQRLQKKIIELEAQTLDYFGSQKNKRTRVGYYKYRLETLMQDPDKYFSEPDKYESNMSGSLAEDTKADTSCYLNAAVDVRVIVWPVDKSGNKGEKMWEGVIKKGERKLIRTPHGKIRIAVSRNLDEDQYTSGEKSRWCDSEKEIGVP